ncbi:hypothetical protein QBC45DRAFT_200503 [Copromyces sp. CBS 386.78]|nr:hypothetical protein QBC45DRAFT_200503 [Copromyces sp. CBS 386.78]
MLEWAVKVFVSFMILLKSVNESDALVFNLWVCHDRFGFVRDQHLLIKMKRSKRFKFQTISYFPICSLSKRRRRRTRIRRNTQTCKRLCSNHKRES